MKCLPLFLCLASPAWAQSTQPIHSKFRVSLDIGSVTVWLGMPKAEALQAFEDAGVTKVQDAGGLYIIVGSGSMGTMAFTNGKLSYSDREWITENKNDVDAMLGALEAVSSHGDSNCHIQNAPMNSPDQKANRVFIDCGDRGVMLMRGSFQATGNITSVTERIGHYVPK